MSLISTKPLSLQTIEHTKTYGVGNQRHGMRKSQKCGGVKTIVNT
jgi:hypothetical protein